MSEKGGGLKVKFPRDQDHSQCKREEVNCICRLVVLLFIYYLFFLDGFDYWCPLSMITLLYFMSRTRLTNPYFCSPNLEYLSFHRSTSYFVNEIKLLPFQDLGSRTCRPVSQAIETVTSPTFSRITARDANARSLNVDLLTPPLASPVALIELNYWISTQYNTIDNLEI